MKSLRSRTVPCDNENNEHNREDPEYSAEANVSKKVKRKKFKKHVKSDQEDKVDENMLNKTEDSEDVNKENVSKKMKCKKLKKHASVTEASNSSTAFQQEAEHTREKSTKKKIKKSRQTTCSTILNSPDFNNVVTSTAIKPKRPEINVESCENENLDNTRLNKLKKLKCIQKEQNSRREFKTEDFDLICNRRETFNITTKNKILNKTNENMPKKSSSMSVAISPNKKSDETDEKNHSFNNLNKSKLSKKQENILRRLKSENTLNNSNSFNNISNDVIVISDSPDISKVKQNSINKSKTIEPEITSDEENISNDSLEQESWKTDESQKRKSVSNRRETFNKLPKKSIFLDASKNIITISDSPEKSTFKKNTFNKSNLQEPEITSDEDDNVKDSLETKQLSNHFNESAKSKILDQKLNHSKTKNNLSTINNTILNRPDTFHKIPKNISLLKSNESISINNGLLESETNKDFEGLSDVNESFVEDIDLSDNPDKSQIKESTFTMSNNATNSTVTKHDIEKKSSNDTYELKIVNTSGDWHVEKLINSSNKDIRTKLNSTFDIENESKSNNGSIGNSTIIVKDVDSTLKNENVSFSPKDKNIRKKWLKFARHSTDAQSVLDQISSPKLLNKMNNSKLTKKIMNTPTDLYKLQKQSVIPTNFSGMKSPKSKKTPLKSFTKTPLKSFTKSPFKSLKKPTLSSSISSSKTSATKRTAMPNFALIHQKAFQKMENLVEYSERKRQRAQMLLSSNKLETKQKSFTKTEEIKTVETKSKSSRQLFTNDEKYNRFGFKIGQANKPTINFAAKPDPHPTIIKPVVKPSVFTRSGVIAIANKNKIVTNNRENKRDILKGVRTNRRFELLMQMRNK